MGKLNIEWANSYRVLRLTHAIATCSSITTNLVELLALATVSQRGAADTGSGLAVVWLQLGWLLSTIDGPVILAINEAKQDVVYLSDLEGHGASLISILN